MWIKSTYRLFKNRTKFIAIILLTPALLCAKQESTQKIECCIESDATIDRDFYNTLSNGEKIHLRQEFKKAFTQLSNEIKQTKPFLDKQPYRIEPEDKRLLFVQLATTLLNIYKNDCIVSLGQSPAWLVETMRLMLDDKNGEQCKHVAFSGGWTADLKSSRSKKKPTQNQIKSYRNYLSSKGLSIEDIITRHQNGGLNPPADGSRTIIFEYVQGGRGLGCFLKVLTDWAKELKKEKEFEQAVLVINTSRSFQKLPKSISQACGNIPFINILPKTTQSNGATLSPFFQNKDAIFDILYELALSDCFEDRLVPRYKYKMWDNPKVDPLNFPATRRINLIRFAILDTLSHL